MKLIEFNRYLINPNQVVSIEPITYSPSTVGYYFKVILTNAEYTRTFRTKEEAEEGYESILIKLRYEYE